ncbi:MAG: 30S ribosomal protein S20 [Candidatus Levybacteria bacterium]|nr:30S ribosomal protein S20 [Candidatus Levybacteria bacterium]
MPILKHAKKKLRQDNKREKQRRKIKELYKAMVKKAKATPTKDSISAAFKAVDKAAKIDIIHPNKAARLKSSLSKVVTSKVPVSTEKTVVSKKAASTSKKVVKTAKSKPKAKSSPKK